MQRKLTLTQKGILKDAREGKIEATGRYTPGYVAIARRLIKSGLLGCDAKLTNEGAQALQTGFYTTH
jgi:hypothetical protein